ncbi:MAG: hypothetical protein HYZ28_14775 [Myxococcales bacterium]|nr:hypothetical protein [Myxococcales bacterium]
MRFLRRAAVVALAAFSCCSGQKPLELPEGCQPLLAGFDCTLPFPSDFFRAKDASLPSGFRLELRGASRPSGKEGISADVGAGRPIDGSSRIPTIVTAFPEEVSSAGFVGLLDPPEGSTEPGSNTLIVEVATGRRIPHFVDLDPRATDRKRQAIVLHPYVGLEARARYAVGFRGVRSADGNAVAVPEGFRRLRDGQAGGDPALEPLRKQSEEVFAALEKAGLPRKELQLAWGFTTGSDEQVTQDMLRVRELTLEWLSSNSPQIEVTKLEEDPDAEVWRRVRGTVKGPLFLESPDPGSALSRDADGRVRQNGTVAFRFVAQLPMSVRDQFGPGLPLAYGHGFFGTLEELTGAGATNLSSRLRAPLFAAEWWGMHQSDVAKVADALIGRPSRALDFVDRVHQGMANWMVLTSAIQRGMRDLPELRRPSSGPGVSVDGNGQSNAGQVTFSAGPPAFVGISQGHIMGGVMAALNPDVSRACLNVGGAGMTQMMMRARPFSGYLFFLELSVPDPLDQQKYIATLQRHFDRMDPATYAAMLVRERLPGSPERQVLMQTGLGDTAVPNLGSFLHARLAGLPVLEPSPAVPYRLEGVAAPTGGSAIALYDFGKDVAAIYRDATPAPSDNEVHEGLRRLEPALEQMDRFFREGRIVHACSGLCDPD